MPRVAFAGGGPAALAYHFSISDEFDPAARKKGLQTEALFTGFE